MNQVKCIFPKISCGFSRPFAHGKKKGFTHGEMCFVCDLYSHSETAHGKSLWIHQREQKNYIVPITFPLNQVVGFIYGLSNHKSSLTNRVEGNGEYRKPQHKLGTFLRCCAEICAK